MFAHIVRWNAVFANSIIEMVAESDWSLGQLDQGDIIKKYNMTTSSL